MPTGSKAPFQPPGSAFPGHGATAFGTFHIKTGHPALVWLPVPAGRADAGPAGTATEPTAPAATSPATAAAAATLPTSWTSFLCKNRHNQSSLRFFHDQIFLQLARCS